MLLTSKWWLCAILIIIGDLRWLSEVSLKFLLKSGWLEKFLSVIYPRLSFFHLIFLSSTYCPQALLELIYLAYLRSSFCVFLRKPSPHIPFRVQGPLSPVFSLGEAILGFYCLLFPHEGCY